jgi:outer membrane murein-binding lipoprotein Lpp
MTRRVLILLALVAMPSLVLAQSADPATQRRLDDLEAQVRALTGEVQRLRQQAPASAQAPEPAPLPASTPKPASAANPASAPLPASAADSRTDELERKVDALAE